MTIYCEQCGKMIDSEYNLCPYCGSEVAKELYNDSTDFYDAASETEKNNGNGFSETFSVPSDKLLLEGKTTPHLFLIFLFLGIVLVIYGIICCALLSDYIETSILMFAVALLCFVFSAFLAESGKAYYKLYENRITGVCYLETGGIKNKLVSFDFKLEDIENVLAVGNLVYINYDGKKYLVNAAKHDKACFIEKTITNFKKP